MADAKAHPSELLEFVSLSPAVALHVEDKTKADQAIPSPNKTDVQAHEHSATDSPPKNQLYRGMSMDSLPSLNSETLSAAQAEHRMTFLHAIRLYPKAVGWSALISMAIIMEGFDTALINSFYAYPEFTRAYGVPDGNNGYQITTHWQSSISNGSVVGGIVGLFANGILTELYGYRKTTIGALLALACFIFLSFFALNVQTLLAGQILSGLSWGIFSTLTTTYAAEVMPLNLRGYLTSNVNMCWLIGQVIALGTLRGCLGWQSKWSYKVPFGLQWIWIAFLLVGVSFAPESPWWLIRQGKPEQAKRSLMRLTRRGLNFNADNTVAMLQHTNETERKMAGGRDLNQYSYLECFRGSNLRRTEIACAIFAIQNLCGLPLIGFAAYFYQQIGFGDERSFDLTMGMHGLAIIGNLIGNVLLRYFGRRRLYLVGLTLQLIILVAAGSISLVAETPTTLWAMAAMVILFIFVFDMMVGPLTYTIVAEIPSTRLRVKTVVLARVCYNICSLITNVLQQHMLNPLSWNWRGKSSWFWAGACVLCIVYCWWRLPETKGLTYLELDILFEKGAGARKFAAFQKTLESTGYFSFQRNESVGGEIEWKERRPSLLGKIGLG